MSRRYEINRTRDLHSAAFALGDDDVLRSCAESNGRDLPPPARISIRCGTRRFMSDDRIPTRVKSTPRAGCNATVELEVAIVPRDQGAGLAPCSSESKSRRGRWCFFVPRATSLSMCAESMLGDIQPQARLSSRFPPRSV